MKKSMKIASGAAGAFLLFSGSLPAQVAEAAPETNKTQNILNEEGFTEVANVEGTFLFNQDVLSPADDVFNMFGTAMVGVCAAPAHAVGTDKVSGYINVSGNLKKTFEVPLEKLMESKKEEKIMSCSCAEMNSAVVNAQVVGIPVSSIVEMAELEDGVNTITFRGADGYGIPMPLSYVLEKDALLVYQINGQDMPETTRNQVWMPESVAKYFTRNVVEIVLTTEEEEPAVLTAEEGARAKINIMNRADKADFAAGDHIVFQGYADDYDVAIAAIEFSMDGGQTWTSCETTGADAGKWVYWEFGIDAEEAGQYQLIARSRTADGKVSPVASVFAFTVNES